VVTTNKKAEARNGGGHGNAFGKRILGGQETKRQIQLKEATDTDCKEEKQLIWKQGVVLDHLPSLYSKKRMGRNLCPFQ